MSRVDSLDQYFPMGICAYKPKTGLFVKLGPHRYIMVDFFEKAVSVEHGPYNLMFHCEYEQPLKIFAEDSWPKSCWRPTKKGLRRTSQKSMLGLCVFFRIIVQVRECMTKNIRSWYRKKPGLLYVSQAARAAFTQLRI